MHILAALHGGGRKRDSSQIPNHARGALSALFSPDLLPASSTKTGNAQFPRRVGFFLSPTPTSLFPPTPFNFFVIKKDD